MGSVESVAIAAAAHATEEEELRACLSTLTEDEKAKLQATLIDLKTPREPLASSRAKKEEEKEIKSEEDKKEVPTKVDEPVREAAKAEEPVKAEETTKLEEPAKAQKPATVEDSSKAEEVAKEKGTTEKTPQASNTNKEESTKTEEASTTASDMDEEESRLSLTEMQTENVRKAFKASDRDNSGAIEARELKVIMKALDVEMTDQDVLVVLENVDIDGNGKIEFNEFLALVGDSLTNYYRSCS